jgi:hypothetical protein
MSPEGKPRVRYIYSTHDYKEWLGRANTVIEGITKINSVLFWKPEVALPAVFSHKRRMNGNAWFPIACEGIVTHYLLLHYFIVLLIHFRTCFTI